MHAQYDMDINLIRDNINDKFMQSVCAKFSENFNVVKRMQHLSKVTRIMFPVQFEFNRFLVFNQLIDDSREKITLINFKE